MQNVNVTIALGLILSTFVCCVIPQSKLNINKAVFLVKKINQKVFDFENLGKKNENYLFFCFTCNSITNSVLYSHKCKLIFCNRFSFLNNFFFFNCRIKIYGKLSWNHYLVLKMNTLKLEVPVKRTNKKISMIFTII